MHEDPIEIIDEDHTVRTQWVATSRRTDDALRRGLEQAATQLDLRLGSHRTTPIEKRYWPTADGLAAADANGITLPDDLADFVHEHPDGYLVLATAETGPAEGGRGKVQ